jgi:membrane protein
MWQLWQSHRVPRVAAALSFYMIFALPPLLFVVVVLGRSLLGRSDTLLTIDAQLSPVVGAAGTRGLNTLVAASQHSVASVPVVVSAGLLLFAIFAIFMQVQEALDDVWEIQENRRGGVWEIVALRLHVIVVILALAALGVTSLILAAAGGRTVAFVANAFAVLVFLLVAYRVLPRVDVSWSSGAIGAVVTTVILILGEAALSFYFTRFHPERRYGDAGSVIVLLLWIYYSALLFFFGATLTRALEDETKNGIAAS